MDDVFAGSLMSSPVHTVTADTSLRDAGELMLDNNIGSVVIVDGDGQLEGIVTATEFIRIIADGDPDPDATVGTVMTTELITTTADEPIQTVADLMINHGFQHLPIIEDGEVIGLISSTDMAAYLSSLRDPSPS